MSATESPNVKARGAALLRHPSLTAGLEVATDAITGQWGQTRYSQAINPCGYAGQGKFVRMTLRHPHLDMTPQRPRRRLDLIEARCMIEIEQPIHLGQMPA